MPQTGFTKFGEPRVEVRGNGFGIDLTPKCNFGCDFCYVTGRPRGKEMTFPEFRSIILEIAEYGKEKGVKPGICVAGGEPFLHKDIAKILSFATQALGRDHVSVTTNFSQFPTSKAEVLSLLRRCGYPKLNLSIDREHLRFDPLAPKRLSAIFAATKELKTNVSVISVAKSAKEAKHRWPRAISRLISAELKEKVAKNFEIGRREFFSDPKQMRHLRKNLVDAKEGKHGALLMEAFSVFGGKPYFGSARLGVNLMFSSDGKLYIDSPIEALHAPQLSIGSWKRESLHSMIAHNLPFKANMVGEWMGELRVDGRVRLPSGAYFNQLAKDNPKKTKLFASYALRRMDKLKLKRTGKH